MKPAFLAPFSLAMRRKIMQPLNDCWALYSPKLYSTNLPSRKPSPFANSSHHFSVTCFDWGLEEGDAAALPGERVGAAPLLGLLLPQLLLLPHLRGRRRHQVLLAVGRHGALPRPV